MSGGSRMTELVQQATRNRSLYEAQLQDLVNEVITVGNDAAKAAFQQIHTILKDKNEKPASKILAMELSKSLVDIDESSAKAAIDTKVLKLLQDYARIAKNRRRSTLFRSSVSDAEVKSCTDMAAGTLHHWALMNRTPSTANGRQLKEAWDVLEREGIQPPPESAQQQGGGGMRGFSSSSLGFSPGAFGGDGGGGRGGQPPPPPPPAGGGGGGGRRPGGGLEETLAMAQSTCDRINQLTSSGGEEQKSTVENLVNEAKAFQNGGLQEEAQLAVEEGRLEDFDRVTNTLDTISRAIEAYEEWARRGFQPTSPSAQPASPSPVGGAGGGSGMPPGMSIDPPPAMPSASPGSGVRRNSRDALGASAAAVGFDAPTTMPASDPPVPPISASPPAREPSPGFGAFGGATSGFPEPAAAAGGGGQGPSPSPQGDANVFDDLAAPPTTGNPDDPFGWLAEENAAAGGGGGATANAATSGGAAAVGPTASFGDPTGGAGVLSAFDAGGMDTSGGGRTSTSKSRKKKGARDSAGGGDVAGAGAFGFDEPAAGVTATQQASPNGGAGAFDFDATGPPGGGAGGADLSSGWGAFDAFGGPPTSGAPPAAAGAFGASSSPAEAGGAAGADPFGATAAFGLGAAGSAAFGAESKKAAGDGGGGLSSGFGFDENGHGQPGRGLGGDSVVPRFGGGVEGEDRGAEGGLKQRPATSMTFGASGPPPFPPTAEGNANGISGSVGGFGRINTDELERAVKGDGATAPSGWDARSIGAASRHAVRAAPDPSTMSEGRLREHAKGLQRELDSVEAELRPRIEAQVRSETAAEMAAERREFVEELDLWKERSRRAEEHIDKMEGRIDALEEEMNEKVGTIERLQANLKEKEQMVAHAKDMWMKESARASALTESLNEADLKISDLDRELLDLNVAHTKTQKELRQLKHLFNSQDPAAAPSDSPLENSLNSLRPHTASAGGMRGRDWPGSARGAAGDGGASFRPQTHRGDLAIDAPPAAELWDDQGGGMDMNPGPYASAVVPGRYAARQDIYRSSSHLPAPPSYPTAAVGTGAVGPLRESPENFGTGAGGALAGGGPKGERFRNLILHNDAVLFEDESLQVGVKASYVDVGGDLNLYFGNKTRGELHSFRSSIFTNNPDGLLVMAPSPVAPTVLARQQVVQQVKVRCHAPFADYPIIKIVYLLPDNSPKEVKLTLPVAVCKFMGPKELSGPQFSRVWKSQQFLLHERTVVVNLAQRYASSMMHLAVACKLGGALEFLHGLDPNPSALLFAGVFPSSAVNSLSIPTAGAVGNAGDGGDLVTPEMGALVLVRLEVGEGQLKGRARLQIRSNDFVLVQAVQRLLQAEIGASIGGGS
uniref:Clathrin adaptor alpha/beta/gamma-adaptin appendage Ig-like subdomain domain-containing protein n=1 Tax=Chromera velia CCMP2878 TaxID=1169474 RepID=A0A0G4G5B0_9ALVE|eukprot:Cvel_20291.t1-p1 / transcript=Cvel_20291.t1 / gene=Cvel_20291 / organism=Chromera_velia_CCMP2878 / gene_product=AP-2 complex subunit alpha-2, putative / transcript_product=AP-2 complex subunit alpha-2, putative / location=Cvel_scaffold1811:24930-37446(-) / protein_length=1350 / sequence_SO=supercontig / SO=protein_coding / is_pseudo=false